MSLCPAHDPPLQLAQAMVFARHLLVRRDVVQEPLRARVFGEKRDPFGVVEEAGPVTELRDRRGECGKRGFKCAPIHTGLPASDRASPRPRANGTYVSPLFWE